MRGNVRECEETRGRVRSRDREEESEGGREEVRARMKSRIEWEGTPPDDLGLCAVSTVYIEPSQSTARMNSTYHDDPLYPLVGGLGEDLSTCVDWVPFGRGVT
jgi:hypothetical protein